MLIFVTVLFLTPLFKSLPEAVLAALIIHAVSHLWKVRALRRYYAERPVEVWLGLATLAGVITIDVLPGLVIGVPGMLLLVIYDASRAQWACWAGSPARVTGRSCPPDARGGGHRDRRQHPARPHER